MQTNSERSIKAIRTTVFYIVVLCFIMARCTKPAKQKIEVIKEKNINLVPIPVGKDTLKVENGGLL